jgi:type IVB pilus formation R64 PilN family outer membrane protein
MLSGCVSPELTHGTDTFAKNATGTADKLSSRLVERTDDATAARDRAAFVNHPYLAGKSIALSPQAKLPLALQANVKTALMFPGHRISLATAAEQITLATHVPVVIAPDVYLPAGALLPRNQKLDDGNGEAQAFPSASPIGQGRIGAGPLPSLSSALNGGLSSAGYSGPPSVDTPQDVDIQREEMPLPQTLDLIATRLGVNWSFDAKKGVIRIYRMVTRTWSVPIKPGLMSYNTVFDSSTAQSNNPSALTTQSDKPGNKSEAQGLSEMTSLLNDIQTVMTRSGSVSGNIATGTVTITDTRDAVDRAENIVNMNRAILSKLITFHVRVIQITRNNSGQLGVDWNAALTKALSSVPGFALSATSPATLVTTTAVGTLGAKITSGQFSGTQAVVSALAELGTVASTDDIPLQVQNRHSVYYDNVNQFTYVSQTTPATATAGGTGGVPGITTSTDQVGLKFLIYASATDDNNIALTLSLGNSSLNGPIQTFTSGTGSNQQSVQEVNKTKRDASTDAIVRNGGIVVLTAHDHNDTQYDKRTLGYKVPLLAGGSENASSTRTTTLFVISASIRDMGAGQTNQGL